MGEETKKTLTEKSDGLYNATPNKKHLQANFLACRAIDNEYVICIAMSVSDDRVYHRQI